MSDTFDPYQKWLGIPPDEQPPNYYRLLGITIFESDPEVIRNASDQRMMYLKSFSNGPRSGLSQQLLNEVSAAKLSLLSDEKKQIYDTKLKLSGSVPTNTVGPSVVQSDSRQPAIFAMGAVFGSTLLGICIGYFAGNYLHDDSSSRKFDTVLSEVRRLTEDKKQLEETIKQLSPPSPKTYVSLEDALREPMKARRLDLSNRGLTQIPSGIDKLIDLEWLNLSGNKLTAVPIYWGWDIVELDVSYNDVTELPETVSNWEYVESLNLSNNKLTSLPPAVSYWAGLKRLNLSNNEIHALPDGILYWTNVVELDLSKNKLNALPPEIRTWDDVEDINLQSNQISSIPEEIKAIPKLRRLDLRDNPISKQEVERIRGWLRRTTILADDLSDAETHDSLHTTSTTDDKQRAIEAIEDVGGSLVFVRNEPLKLVLYKAKGSVLRYLAALPSIQLVQLDELDLTDNDLVHLQSLGNLRILTLQNLRLSDTEFSHIARLTNLEALFLSQTTFPPHALRHLIALTKLHHLGLGPPVTDQCAEYLSELPAMRRLSINGSGFTNEGVRNLAKLDRLMSLDLSGTQVTDASLFHLAMLRNLQRLRLVNNPIVGPGLAHMARHHRLNELIIFGDSVTGEVFQYLGHEQKLDILSVGGPNVTDDSLVGLNELPPIRRLFLTYTSLTDEGIRAVKNALPNCEIITGR